MVKISMVQMNTSDDKELNLHTARTFIEQAVSEGSELVCLPETFNWLGHEKDKPAHAE